jgi:hypothetical protein
MRDCQNRPKLVSEHEELGKEGVRHLSSPTSVCARLILVRPNGANIKLRRAKENHNKHTWIVAKEFQSAHVSKMVHLRRILHGVEIITRCVTTAIRAQ